MKSSIALTASFAFFSARFSILCYTGKVGRPDGPPSDESGLGPYTVFGRAAHIALSLQSSHVSLLVPLLADCMHSLKIAWLHAGPDSWHSLGITQILRFVVVCINSTVRNWWSLCGGVLRFREVEHLEVDASRGSWWLTPWSFDVFGGDLLVQMKPRFYSVSAAISMNGLMCSKGDQESQFRV